MNASMLKAEIARNELSIPKLADLIGIGKKAMYEKLDGKTEFKQTEISKIIKSLDFSMEQAKEIFFADNVS